MTFLIIFIVGIIGIVLLVEYKLWQIRHGKIKHQEEEFEIDITEVAQTVGRKTVISIKNGLQHTMLSITKGYLKALIVTKKYVQTKFPKFYALFSVKHAIEAAQEAQTKTTSFFWRSVAEYKYKIKNAKHKIYQEIEEKSKQEPESEQKEPEATQTTEENI